MCIRDRRERERARAQRRMNRWVAAACAPPRAARSRRRARHGPRVPRRARPSLAPVASRALREKRRGDKRIGLNGCRRWSRAGCQDGRACEGEGGVRRDTEGAGRGCFLQRMRQSPAFSLTARTSSPAAFRMRLHKHRIEQAKGVSATRCEALAPRGARRWRHA
eukprot:6096903-Pleurochrysis_carterae.AAC.1